jgi:predicted transposase YbfD/YdcC
MSRAEPERILASRFRIRARGRGVGHPALLAETRTGGNKGGLSTPPPNHPSHDHLGDIFAALDAEQFQRCFVAWVAALTGVPVGVVAIDGKTVRRSGGKAGKGAIHMVSAFAASQRLVLGQVKVAEKSNEIVAIPKLLDLLAIEGAIVTIDAMGCQRAIARKIIEKKADYVFGLKGNQGSLRDDVELLVNEQKARDFKDTTISRAETIDADNGRIVHLRNGCWGCDGHFSFLVVRPRGTKFGNRQELSGTIWTTRCQARPFGSSLTGLRHCPNHDGSLAYHKSDVSFGKQQRGGDACRIPRRPDRQNS